MPFVCLCVCLDVNYGGTNRNRCTQRLVILRAQTYQWSLITHPKPGRPDLLELHQFLGHHRNVYYLCKLLTNGRQLCIAS